MAHAAFIALRSPVIRAFSLMSALGQRPGRTWAFLGPTSPVGSFSRVFQACPDSIRRFSEVSKAGFSLRPLRGGQCFEHVRTGAASNVLFFSREFRLARPGLALFKESMPNCVTEEQQ